MDIQIELLESIDDAPMELLLLADPFEETVQAYLGDGQCYIAKLHDDIVGVIVVLRTRPGMAEIMNVAVREDIQNQGIGKQLIHHVIEAMRKTDLHTLEIGTGNPGAQQMMLYQKCGFRIVGVDFDYFRKRCPERIYYKGIECRDMIRMRMELNEEDN